MNKKLIFAVLVFLILAGLSGCAVRERIAINTPSDSYVWGGGDIVFYSDDHATQTARIIGESGGINATGVVTASGGMVFGGPISDNAGSFRINDNVLVTGTLQTSGQITATSQINALNGLAVTGNLTVTTLVSQTTQVIADGVSSTGYMTAGVNFDLAGNAMSTSGSFRINDNTLITGTLGVTGTIAGGYQLTVADNMTVTKNGTVSQQMNVGNGLVVAGGITSSGQVTVSNWGLFYGIVLQPAVAQVVTANYGITPGNYSLLYLADDGEQATGTIALDTTTSIVAGTYGGQLLIVYWMDAAGATLTIQDGGNMQGPANADVVLGYLDSAWFMWDVLTADWLCTNVTDL
jgi:hypothetical protein